MSQHGAPGWSQAGTRAAARLPEPRPEDFDALADLFLGPDEVRSAPRPSHGEGGGQHSPEIGPEAPIELLVLGHLPVRAPLWARQYAWEVAQQEPHPVGLVRLAAGTLQVEMLAPGLEPDEPLTDVAAALRQMWGRSGRVLVRVDEPDEPRLAGWSEVTALTLLSGVDDAAVVAAYRAIKSLGNAGADEAPDVRVAWMGCAPDAARAAMEKLERACQAFLNRPLAFAECAARIDSARGQVLYRGPVPEGASLEHLLTAARRESGARRAAQAESRAEDAQTRPGVLRLAGEMDDSACDDAWWDAPPERSARAEGGTDRAAAGHGSPGAPAAKDTGQATALEGDAPACLSILLKGLTPLPVRSPDAPEVELALDAQGGLHLLAFDRGAGAASLCAAQAWAKRHSALLAMACPGLRPEAGGGAQLHMVTVDAPGAAHLLFAPMHIHLAVRSSDGWLLAPLNR